MAITGTMSNHGNYQYMKGALNLSSGVTTLKIILMATGFTFNKDTHATYADVSASELANGNGYAVNTKTLTSVVLTEDDTGDRGHLTCDNVVWTASGGSIGPSPVAIVFDDASSDDTIIGGLDFGGDQTATTGNTFTISGITIDLTGA